jgi:hypothetical protein
MTFARRSVAAVVALSFFAMIVPVMSVSFATDSTMACCAGKSAGHCDSALKLAKPKPKPEPMCGHKSEPVDDDVTVVAEEIQASSEPAVTPSSIGKPCHTDCCASVARSKQSKRERVSLRPSAPQKRPTILTVKETLTAVGESTNYVEHLIPRGPPQLT